MANILQRLLSVGEASLAYNVTLLAASYLIKLLPTRGTQYRLRNDYYAVTRLQHYSANWPLLNTKSKQHSREIRKTRGT